MTKRQKQIEKVRIWEAIAILVAIAAAIMAMVWSVAFNIYIAGQMGYIEFAAISIFGIVA